MELDESIQAQATAIEVLGMLFCTDPVLDRAQGDVFDALRALDVDDAAARWPYVSPDALKPLLDDMKSGIVDDRDDLASEYRRLFVGPQFLDAPPYGSVYTDREQVLFGESTLALKAWLREVGIAIDDNAGQPEDHIGTLMLLWSWVIRTKPDLVCDYLRLHVLTWAPHYLGLLEQAAKSGFYAALARLALMTLEGAQDQLGIEVETPKFYR